jgi:NTE family protein
VSVSVEPRVETPSFFEGLSADAVAEILAGLETRRFPAGTIVVAEGDSPRQLYLVESGTAEVLTDGQPVGSVQPGTTIAEMSFFTHEPAAATVRAVDDVVVHPIGEREFERISIAHPQVYRNLTAILSARLARTNRLAARQANARGKLVVLSGGPPLTAYALACSMAWHTREPIALLVVGEAPELEPFAVGGDPPPPRATVTFDRSASNGSIPELAERLCGRYAHVLVLAANAALATLADAQSAELPTGLALAAADEEGLHAGLLPSRTEAGRTLGSQARRLTGLTVGLALGAGGLRGFAHVGILKGLDRIGLVPDFVCGTSIGASVAAGYAMGFDCDKVERLVEGSARTIFKPNLPYRSFLRSKPLGRYLKEKCEGNRIEDLAVPLAVVAADLKSHREVVFRKGVVWRAILASMAIPGIFPAQRMGPLTLVDGGVVNTVPAGVATDMGAAKVIAVRLFSLASGPDIDSEAIEESSSKPPSAIRVILRSFEIMQARTAREGSGGASVTISPELGEIPTGKLKNFGVGLRYVEAGEAAFDESLPRLASVLPWLRA